MAGVPVCAFALSRTKRVTAERTRQGKGLDYDRDFTAGAFEGVGLDTFRMEEVLLGTTPEQRGLLADASLADRGWFGRAFLRAMHKTEPGRTLGDDFHVAAANEL